MECVQTKRIGISLHPDGGKYYVPLFADTTGTWKMVIADEPYEFEAVENEMLVVPDDFTEDEYNTFQLRRPDNTLFNNTCYVTYFLPSETVE